ncbi:aldehyde oxidase GLOX1-like [Salvia splendens]|uniref:aldehyde oxidase GLOX1-like n=1 Tax=Salvia splendens TaxID=180675 RepID=UPI001C252E38|nr:aldehyde oxidase GLOX1-like [Salvia splendens]
MTPPSLPLCLPLWPAPRGWGGGKWDLLLSNLGTSAMHMQLLHTDRVVMFDRTNFGSSNISLPEGECVHDRLDCTAHSVASNSVRPLTLSTNIWCSSGAVLPPGGNGNNNNYSCNWQETTKALSQRRWYATSHILPDGRQIIVGGRGKFNYEFYPKKSAGEGSYNLPFLYQTFQSGKENSLYPFVLLNIDGTLFIFANNRAILFDHMNSKLIRTYPTLPGGTPGTTPARLCAPTCSYERAYNNRDFVEALNTCGRIRINDPDPQWVMETMPLARVMGDMLLLPDGNVLIINCAAFGTAAWELGRSPVLSPVLYYPDNQPGLRFEVQNPTTTPRMYHSSAILLRDGRVIVGGSNPHEFYNFTNVLFPTDLTLESFSPPYLDPQFGYLRPWILSPVSGSEVGYWQDVMIRFSVGSGRVVKIKIMVTMIAPAFATHSFSMNQRLLILDGWDVKAVGRSKYQLRVRMPGSGNFAPGGYYLLFVVHRDIPSEGIWIHIS